MTDEPKPMEEFWDAYAASFAQPLQSNGLVGKFVSNPNVTGAYAEAWVRSITRQMVGLRFRVSTGAIIRAGDQIRGTKDVPQCDLVIWNPAEMPGLFEAEDFALVPFFSARAVVEIKRSTTDVDSFREQLSRQAKYVPDQCAFGVVVQHPSPLFDLRCESDWLRKASAPKLTRLLDGSGKPDTNGIMAFIYFLAQIGGHYNPIAQSSHGEVEHKPAS